LNTLYIQRHPYTDKIYYNLILFDEHNRLDTIEKLFRDDSFL